MADIIHVTMQNLKDFQDWLLSLRERNWAENIYLDLPLDVVLNHAPKNLSQAAQETLAYIVAGDRGNRDLDRDVNFMLDNADKFPHLLGRAFSYSGSRRTGYIYGIIMDTIRKRPIDQNIAAIYAMLQYDRIHSSKLGTGMVSKTSRETAQMLNEIFIEAM
ncbi:hypothetical protein HDR66_03820, partial [bacterium]|nr:hypothetical protein [bacterium]